MPFGLMAQRTLVDPGRVVELPAGLDPLVAAAIPNPGLSAFYSLEYGARVQAGQNLLVLGATGVAGSVAVQLAKKKYRVGRVVVVGRNTERLAWLRGVGADEAISMDADDYVQRLAAEHKAHPFDAVLDYVWGPPAEGALAALSNSSLSADFHATRFVQIGAMAAPTITLSAGTVRSAGIELVGLGPSSLPPEVHSRIGTELLPALFAMANDGILAVEPRPHSLSEVEALWTATEPSGTRVVLVP
jgi:NADPH:quinone reductase-like Zn-dependent oxidoreductase